MKLYSDKLTAADVYAAFSGALAHGVDIRPDGVRQFRARQVTTYGLDNNDRPVRRTFRKSNGVQFYAYSMGGKRATGHRAIGSYPLDGERRAASWDAYGYVIASLFRMDPDAVIGNYAGRDDFIRQVEEASRKEPKDFLSLVES